MRLILLISFLMVHGDDYIRLRNGKVEKGKIIEANEKEIRVAIASGGEVYFTYDMLEPQYAYDVLRKYVFKGNKAVDHIKLADHCRKNGLYRLAIEEYERGLEKDKSMKAQVEKAIKDTITEDARNKYERAKKIIDEDKPEKYKEAAAILKDLMLNYSETPYSDLAKKHDSELAEKIRKIMEDEEKKREEMERMKIQLEKEKEGKLVKDIQKAILDAREIWNQGLDYETDLVKSGLAASKWNQAETKLLEAKKSAELLAKFGKEQNTQKELQVLIPMIDSWLMRVYYTLGRFYAQEADYLKAMHWLNKALKIDPDNAVANTLKLEITLHIIKMKQPK